MATDAVGLPISGWLFSSFELDFMDYQCSGGEHNLSSCAVDHLQACQTLASVRCQGMLISQLLLC